MKNIDKIITICKQLYFTVTPTPIPQHTGLQSFDIGSIIQKLLDVLIGLMTIYLIKLKWEQGTATSSQAMKLLKKLEEKEKENLKLQTEIRAWKKHHSRLTNAKHY